MASPSFHPEAGAEYADAIAWYQARSVRAAARFESAVERMLELIAANPESFPAYDDEHRFAVLRRFPYTLIYRVDVGQVFVVAVAHRSRPPGYWSGRA